MALALYNFISKSKEQFTSLVPSKVGMYVCGPTVYGAPHLGHARSAIVFDTLYRYLQYSSYSVRYVRNITDVGHLENEVQESGEDKLLKQSKLENKEPMELAQFYNNSYHQALTTLNVLFPSIEPLATGHIPEQQEYIAQLMEHGMAYEAGGSVYFDMQKFLQAHKNVYGTLSGVSVEEMQSNMRAQNFQKEKRNPLDFSLWKKAEKNHIMKWRSPWSEEGFPGWHTECIAMSKKYLGIPFDIHGGGLDLQFPHHEAEIAQAYCLHNVFPARYWVYNNLITIEHQKMSKSLGNFITINDCFTGNHPKLSKEYSPNVLRFFLLRSHYRSILDFTDEALQGTERGLEKILRLLKKIEQKLLYCYLGSDEKVGDLCHSRYVYCTFFNESCRGLIEKAKLLHGEPAEFLSQMEAHMDDDLDTPAAIAVLFSLAKNIESQLERGREDMGCQLVFYVFSHVVFGLQVEHEEPIRYKNMVDELLKLRQKAREEKNFDFADHIRDVLLQANIVIKDTKDGTSYWEY